MAALTHELPHVPLTEAVPAMELIPRMNWTAVVTVAAVLTAITSATWQIRGNQSEQRIQQCIEENATLKGARDWNLPQTLHLLKEASDSAKLNISERKELEGLRSEIGSLRDSQQQSATELRSARTALEKAELALARTLPSKDVPFQISQGKGREIIPGLLVIALTDVSTSSAQFRINGEEKRLAVGDHWNMHLGNRQCALVLLDTNYPNAGGVVRCSQK